MNDVQLAYNAFGQLTSDYQEHGGAVNLSTTPEVAYGYADGSANTIRPTTMTYPNGRVLTFDYGASQADAASRVNALIDNDGITQLAAYSYLGTGAFVIANSPQPNVQYTLIGTAGGNDPVTGDIYRGLDLFGRIKDSYWYNTGTATDADRIQYGYDRAGNRTYRQNTVAESLTAEFDELYQYDGIQRLKDMQRGTLNSTQTGLTSESFAQCWGLDATGNWQGFQEDDTGAGIWSLVQSRAANTVNEITRVTNSTGPAWAQPAYDKNGNMTTVPQPANPGSAYTATYDAWNRLVKLVDAPTGDTVQVNQYDGRKYRTVRETYTSGTLSEARHYYYSHRWQSLEERLGASPDTAAAERQFVWGERYIDNLVIRDFNGA